VRGLVVDMEEKGKANLMEKGEDERWECQVEKED